MLTQAGHDVFTPTLTGVGERSHLLKLDINLDTHILDVVNEIRWQELNNVVLVGHSYAGMVVTGVAEKMEKSIASIVMLDAFFPETGEALVDLQPPQVRDSFLAAERNGALAMPPRPAAMFKVNEKDRAWVDVQCTPHPLKCFLQRLTLTRARERIGKKTYIRATGYVSDSFDRAMTNAEQRAGAFTRCRAGTTSCWICRNGWLEYCRKRSNRPCLLRGVGRGCVHPCSPSFRQRAFATPEPFRPKML
jgi:pimeloyl-ACP methyl ester carboxylesterase